MTAFLSTYRLQLHAGFDFEAATRILPYLAKLGISHVYCSPVWRARAGSLHGYDVADHSRISEELGGEPGLRRFAAAARARGLGLLLDIVPNHMGVFGADNPWWLDVLENGQSSEFATYFDIDWHPPNRTLDAKLLVPVLGDHYGQLIDAGALTLGFDAEHGSFALHYEEHLFPLDPSTYPALLDPLGDWLPAWVRAGYAQLPSRDDQDASARATRRTEQRRLQQEIARLAADAARRAEIERVVADFNAATGRDALSALHDAQAYRLSYWRVASSEINYRRFFDVSALAALRVEDEAVFEATQGLALDLAAEGIADGLRVDHPDGLHDPAAYFDRLQAGYARRVEARGATVAGPLYVVAEKIVGEGEQLPAWPIAGTTGYEFAALVNGWFVERAHAARLERIWHAYTGNQASYTESVRECKLRIAAKSFSAESTVLANALYRIAQRDRHTRDYSLDDLRAAVDAAAACMPVYRTYVAESASLQDVRFVDVALALARRHVEVDDPGVFDFLRSCLVPAEPATGWRDDEVDRKRFAMRFQQFSSPVAAKGVEDTAFYRYHRLISLNEVGASPASFGVSTAQYHAADAARQREWPRALLASSTHDNKRSEDVRYRIDVLSEQPASLRLGLRRWRAATERLRVPVDGTLAPSRDDLSLLYQTLLGTLPHADSPAAESDRYEQRIQDYMVKAQREAKVHTSWSRPQEAYEAATRQLIERVLSDSAGNSALPHLRERAADLAWFGALNSLSATVLKLTSPGVPDIYQGTELIDLSLVDPDNRRPVDYDHRAAMLEALGAAPDAGALARTATDGRLKLWFIARLLELRRERPGLFSSAYVALRVRGHRRGSAIAFARRDAASTLIVIAGRKFASTGLGRGDLPGRDYWGDTSIVRPAWLNASQNGALNVLTGRDIGLGTPSLALGEMLGGLTAAAILVTHG